MAFCSNCGKQFDDQAKVCPYCGTVNRRAAAAPAGSAPQNPYPTAPVQQVYVQQAPITQDQLPPQYRPLGAWQYFALNLLFAIPIVGFVFLIVFSFKRSNINRRNYARSFFCALIVAVGLFLVLLLILLIFGLSLSDLT